MDTHVIYKIITFFDNIDDMLNNFIDGMELTPVQITHNLYVTGLRRSQSNYTSVDLHVKEIRKIKLTDTTKNITDEGGLMMMEPDNEMWISASIISENILQAILDKFITTFGNLNTFYLMLIKWKDENDKFNHVEVKLYENKRVACKEALKLKKQHKNTSFKFEMYNKEGELIENNNNTIQTQTDFELITAKVE